jgi:hypothetical protein
MKHEPKQRPFPKSQGMEIAVHLMMPKQITSIVSLAISPIIFSTYLKGPMISAQRSRLWLR